jgi:hypothetical protein
MTQATGRVVSASGSAAEWDSLDSYEPLRFKPNLVRLRLVQGRTPPGELRVAVTDGASLFYELATRRRLWRYLKIFVGLGGLFQVYARAVAELAQRKNIV